MVTLNWIQSAVEKTRYFYSRHADIERKNDNLTISDIEQALKSGKIIESYANTGRGESCLVAGFTNAGTPIHTVCGKSGDQLVIVTVYIPKPPKFKTPFERS